MIHIVFFFFNIDLDLCLFYIELTTFFNSGQSKKRPCCQRENPDKIQDYLDLDVDLDLECIIIIIQNIFFFASLCC